MADNKRDYYEVLGVDKNATEDDLKRAYPFGYALSTFNFKLKLYC